MPDLKAGRRFSIGPRGVVRRWGTAVVPALAMAVLLPALALGLLTSAVKAPTERVSQTSSVAFHQTLPVEVGLEEAAPRTASGSLARVTESSRKPRVYLIDSESWSDRSRQMVNDALAALPASVQEQLGNPALGDVFVSVNREGRTLSGSQPYHRAANFFSTNEGRNEVVLFPDQSARTALHELGHAYNLRHIAAGSYAQVYLDDEMKTFLEAARWRVLTPVSELRNLRDHADVQVAYEGPPIWSRLSREDPLEDFANSFALYFSAPLELKSLSPSRYNWFVARFASN